MAKNNSRTTNSLYNFTTSIGGQFLTIVMQFVVRTVFISALGKSYLGISGLFSNILSMLSLAEFGVGNAILFKLYEPLAKDDHMRIAILMKFYRKVYTIIGIAVGAIGLILIPFLPNLISDYDKLSALNIRPVLIFVIYLSNSVASYLFFAYKSAIIRADQKEYLLNLISYLFTVGSGILQIILLLIFPNFELYVAIHTISVIVQNIVNARMADKLYPCINEKTEETLSKKEVKGVFKDCSALFLYRLNGVVLKATDNIVISIFLGIEMVGMYSNYYIFYTTIDKLIAKVFGAVAHSLGNLHASHDVDHEYQIYEVMMLVTAIIGGTAGVGIALVSNTFVKVWIGDAWLITQPFAILMGLEVFTLAFRQVLSKYRTAMGLFQQAKYRPLAGMIINLIVSVYGVNKFGICGVLIGTIIADWSTMMWFDPMIIHKYGFENAFSVFRYYKKFVKYFVTTVLVGTADLFLCSFVNFGNGWINVILQGAICALSVPAVLVLASVKTTEGLYVYKLGMNYVDKIAKKIMKGR